MALFVLYCTDQSEGSNRVHRSRELCPRHGQIKCVGLVPAIAGHLAGHCRGERGTNRIARPANSIGDDTDNCWPSVAATDGIEGSHDRTTDEHYGGKIDDVFVVVASEFEQVDE